MGVLMERMAEASADEPRAGTIFSIVLSLISMAVLAICMIYYSSIVKTAHQRSALPLQLDWNANSLLRSHRVEFYLVSVALSFCCKGALVDSDSKADSPIMRTAFDILVNVYLTFLFLVPLQGLYSYKNNPNSQTRTVALRTFIGSCCALTSSVVPRSIPENMGFSNRDHLFTSTNGMNGAKPDGYSYARDAIDLPTVTTTVTAGVGVGEILNEEEKKKNRGLENGNGNGEAGIRKPKMAITVERDHVREVVETGIRIVNDRDHERLILTLPRSISGGGGSIGIEIGDGEKERGGGRIGEDDDTNISF
ncbi:hypothetical protein BHYA_0216g00110 [Botrytis hyacinthi]|uniref:Uncharacterized protein n=1 Tax=Botrytis hyacinthi TaxID=278943 RepID=A0A4Z1GD75_9HELO|nr:hypothetical protein BHYA_0216g00110 [Botrytis hyacinthi]